MKIKRRSKKIPIIIGILLGCIVLTPWPSDVLGWPLVVNQVPVKSDVIVVLGSGTRRGDDPVPPQAKARVQKGLELQQQGLAAQLIVTGGYSDRTKKTESTTMKTYARSVGADSETIHEERRARDTRENAFYTFRLMQTEGWHSAIVVTSDYHTRRACHLFKKYPIAVRCVASRRQLPGQYSPYENLLDFRSVVREYGAWVYFYVREYL